MICDSRKQIRTLKDDRKLKLIAGLYWDVPAYRLIGERAAV